MNTRARRVLIVDDNADDRAEIRRLLERRGAGHLISEAATGEEGLQAVQSARPDCVLLDYHLPDMDGDEFIRRLRGADERRSPPVAVALVTSQEQDDVASRVLVLGAQDYLIKDSLTPPSLARAVENAIEKFRIQRELEEQRVAAEFRSRRLEALREELQTNLAELADAQRARERFLAMMSHEMRTPLNAIIGYADLLDLELDGPLTEGQRQHLARIRVGSRHLLDLINDVLDLARADAHRLELDVRAVDLYAVLEEVVMLLQSQAAAKGLQLRLDPPPAGLPHVTADLQRLRQIMTNLVGNAIKFTEEGAVTLQAEVGDGTVRVYVRDTGIGIDPTVLPLIFDDFFQARGELTREKGGSGLGLAIARRLAELMDGDIAVDSVPGEGSVFTLTLRTATGGELRSEDVEKHSSRMETLAPAASRPLRDVVTVAAFGASADRLTDLERHVRGGVRLVWTTDPAEVPGLAVREGAALVVLDMGSAAHAAWQAATAMQDLAELANTAILLLPSIPPAAPVDGAEGLDLGWVSLVPKPFTPQQLTRAVQAAARGVDDNRGGGYTVLIVDDDPDSRRVAATFLIDADVTVREVADGESALLEMRRDPPDVVVLDLMMPVLDGFGVLAAMRTDPLLATIPVVVLTAKSLSEAERQFLARSTVRVLQKGEYRLADVAALVLRAARSPQLS